MFYSIFTVKVYIAFYSKYSNFILSNFLAFSSNIYICFISFFNNFIFLIYEYNFLMSLFTYYSIELIFFIRYLSYSKPYSSEEFLLSSSINYFICFLYVRNRLEAVSHFSFICVMCNLRPLFSYYY